MIEKVKELLDYNSETGVFTWKTKIGTNCRAGKLAGSLTDEGYIRIKLCGKSYQVHRLVWLMEYGKFPEYYIDHINGIKTDNRICNLRNATSRENQQNTIKHRNGKLVGACYIKSKQRWRARAKIAGCEVHLGYFSTEEMAHSAYQNYLIQKGLK
jgi:hypothetical protein